MFVIIFDGISIIYIMWWLVFISFISFCCLKKVGHYILRIYVIFHFFNNIETYIFSSILVPVECVYILVVFELHAMYITYKSNKKNTTGLKFSFSMFIFCYCPTIYPVICTRYTCYILCRMLSTNFFMVLIP